MVFRAFYGAKSFSSSLLNPWCGNSGFANGWLENDGLDNVGLACGFTKVFNFGSWHKPLSAFGNCEPNCLFELEVWSP